MVSSNPKRCDMLSKLDQCTSKVSGEQHPVLYVAKSNCVGSHLIEHSNSQTKRRLQTYYILYSSTISEDFCTTRRIQQERTQSSTQMKIEDEWTVLMQDVLHKLQVHHHFTTIIRCKPVLVVKFRPHHIR